MSTTTTVGLGETIAAWLHDHANQLEAAARDVEIDITNPEALEMHAFRLRLPDATRLLADGIGQASAEDIIIALRRLGNSARK